MKDAGWSNAEGFSIGFYTPRGPYHHAFGVTEEDYAMKWVSYLNGGTDRP
jgi:hypothetical protein